MRAAADSTGATYFGQPIGSPRTWLAAGMGVDAGTAGGRTGSANRAPTSAFTAVAAIARPRSRGHARAG